MKYIKLFLLLFLVFIFSCTKLDETFRAELSQNNSGTVSPADLLTNAYNSISGTFETGNYWHLQEHTSDESIAPTRGPDWYDNGQWQSLHAHTWQPDHGIIGGAFSDLLSAQFAA